jgi:hypothetical protein
VCSSTTRRRKHSRSRNSTRSSTSTLILRHDHEHARLLPLVRPRLSSSAVFLPPIPSPRVCTRARHADNRTAHSQHPVAPPLPPRRHHNVPQCARRLTSSRHNSKMTALVGATWMQTQTQTRTASQIRATCWHKKMKRKRGHSQRRRHHHHRRADHRPHITRKHRFRRHKQRNKPSPVPRQQRNPRSRHNLARPLVCPPQQTQHRRRHRYQHQHRRRHRRNRDLGPSRQRLRHNILHRHLSRRGPRSAPRPPPQWGIATLKTLRSEVRSHL